MFKVSHDRSQFYIKAISRNVQLWSRRTFKKRCLCVYIHLKAFGFYIFLKCRQHKPCSLFYWSTQSSRGQSYSSMNWEQHFLDIKCICYDQHSSHLKRAHHATQTFPKNLEKKNKKNKVSVHQMCNYQRKSSWFHQMSFWLTDFLLNDCEIITARDYLPRLNTLLSQLITKMNSCRSFWSRTNGKTKLPLKFHFILRQGISQFMKSCHDNNFVIHLPDEK